MKIDNILQEMGYIKLRKLGKGAFSEVYLVKKAQTGEQIACKISREEKILLREYQIMLRIQHELFPICYGLERRGEFSFLFMEYVRGTSLDQYVQGYGDISEEQVVEMVRELSRGLQYLHELVNPIFYLDLKPENIMIQENGELRLLDLGSAGTELMLQHVMTGTIGFAAPEQFVREEQVGIYSDVYALGRLMFWLCPRCSVELQCVIKQCIRERIQERIPNMREVRRRLDAIRWVSKGKRKELRLSKFRKSKLMNDVWYEKTIIRYSDL